MSKTQVSDWVLSSLSWQALLAEEVSSGQGTSVFSPSVFLSSFIHSSGTGDSQQRGHAIELNTSQLLVQWRPLRALGPSPRPKCHLSPFPRLEQDIKKLKADLQASRQVEQELRSQISSLSSTERGIRSEMGQLRQENELLQNKYVHLMGLWQFLLLCGEDTQSQAGQETWPSFPVL